MKSSSERLDRNLQTVTLMDETTLQFLDQVVEKFVAFAKEQ